MIYFDPIADLSDASTLSKLTNGQSFGNIKEDSTSWTGDDVSITTIKNEQGNVVASVPTAGTYSWEFTLLEFDDAIVKKLFNGLDITAAELTVDWLKAATTAKIVGIGTELPMVEMPVALVNQSLNKVILAPKAQVTSSFVIEDKMVAIKCTVNAQMVNAAGLKTITIISGALSYAE